MHHQKLTLYINTMPGATAVWLLMVTLTLPLVGDEVLPVVQMILYHSVTAVGLH